MALITGNSIDMKQIETCFDAVYIKDRNSTRKECITRKASTPCHATLKSIEA